MDFKFENQGANTYLVYKINLDDVVDTMSLGMLTNNKIPGLAQTLFTQMDTEKYIKYNVSAKISVKQFFSGPVNKKRLIGVFSGIVDAMISAEDYMIDIDSILLDVDYIFADVSTCETVLICLPIENGRKSNIDLGNFFKNIMFSTQFDQTENCDHVAQIINYLNSTPVFSILDFKVLLDKIKSKEDGNITSKTQSVTHARTTMQQPVVTPISSDNSPQTKVETSIIDQIPTKSQQSIHASQKKIVTPQVQIPSEQQKTTKTANTSEKKISMFDLLMHYSKENAQLYKEQKAAKKNNSASNSPKRSGAQKNVNKSFKVPNTLDSNMDFAIPGQTVSGSSVQSEVSQPSVQPQSKTSKSHSKVDQPYPKVTQLQTKAATMVSVQDVYQQPITPQSQTVNFGETIVLGQALGETTVLEGKKQSEMITPYLLRIKNNEKILINKPVFRIGKERSYVDYFIGDNTAISRSHANIVTRDDRYYIVDTNSTNHTYLNGQMIQSSTEVEISHDSKIRLANEDFEFKLY